MKPTFLTGVALASFLASPASATDLVVKMGYGLFEPGRIAVARGDRVVFANQDTQAHEVSSATQGHAFRLGELKPGEAKTHAFASPGVVEVICAYHPGMEMTVTVR